MGPFPRWLKYAKDAWAFDKLVRDATAGVAPAWADITGKPTTFPPVVGTTATTAKAGNYAPTTAEVSTALKTKTQIVALASVTVADATDATTAAALANANKVAINALIAAIKA